MLTPTDYDNIKLLFNTTNQIYYLYCNLIKLDKNNQVNSDKYNTILKKIVTFENTENNFILDLCINPDKIESIMDYINDYTLTNSYVKKRILLKLDKQLGKYFLKHNKNLIQNEYKQALTNDIFNIAIYFINQEIKNTSNSYILEQLIEFKYKDLFLGLDSSLDIVKYIDIKDVTLSYDYVFEFSEFIRNLKHNNDEEEMIKNLYIKVKLLEYTNELLNIKNEQISNEDTMFRIMILKSYIKACLSFLNKEEKEHILNKFNAQYKNTITKEILISTFNNTDLPNIIKVKMKIK